MSTVFRLVQKGFPHRRFETLSGAFLLGRSPECEIVLPDPHVSRHQAEVREENGRHRIRNLGRSDLQLNGMPIEEAVLERGDVIAIGGSRFEYLPEESARPEEPPAGAAATVLVSAPDEGAAAERLVVTLPDGRSSVHAIAKEAFLIGRGAEADLALADPAVSRRHCLIEKRGGRRIARNVSASNPIAVNDRLVHEAELSPGDRLQVGGCTLRYVAGAAEAATPQRRDRPRRLLAAAAAAAALALLAWTAFRDGDAAAGIEAAARRLAAGEIEEARRTLRPILGRGLPPAQRAQATALAGRAAGEAARRLAREGLLPAAIAELEAFLALPDPGPEAAALAEQLNGCRLEYGRRLEAAGDLAAALAAYRAVSAGSASYAEARLAVQRLEEARRMETEPQPTVRRLLEEAEAHFAARRYFAPSGPAAVKLYQAVLALAPENQTAASRLAEIQALCTAEGERRFKAGAWEAALEEFTRALIIAPEEPELRRRIALCSRKLSAAAEKPTGGRQTTDGGRPAARQEERRRVERLLKESGAESPWILRYLFEEGGHAGGKSETPW